MSAILVLALVFGSTISYLIVERQRDNQFSLGLVKIGLTEDNYPQEEESRMMSPLSVISKDPRVQNLGRSDVIVFIALKVPYDEVLMVDETTNRLIEGGAKYRELFDLYSNSENAVSLSDTAGYSAGFVCTDTGNITTDPSWVFVDSIEDTSSKTHTYIFGYSKVLEPDSPRTPALFDEMRLRNIYEGQLSSEETRSVEVRAFGIQSDELPQEAQADDPQDLPQGTLKKVYDIYRRQQEVH